MPVPGTDRDIVGVVMEKEKTDFFRIGVITEPHGIKGEVKVYATTDDVAHLKKVKEVWLQEKEEKKLLHLKAVRPQNDRLIMAFQEFGDRTAVEGLRKRELYIRREDAAAPEEGEYFVSDLVGMEVYEEGVLIGELVDVMETGANDVYVIRRVDESELLLPAIRQCVEHIDVEANRMDVRVMEGL